MFQRGIRLLTILLSFVATLGCEKDNVKKSGSQTMSPSPQLQATFTDPHSFARPAEALAKHLDLDIEVDFDKKQIRGVAAYDIETKKDSALLVFDTQDLDILTVTNGSDSLPFTMGTTDPQLGTPLEIPLSPVTKRVVIHFATRPGAKALQWLDPGQTAGKQHPFLFTQSQAILARTWLPCQDSPGIRFTYKARVRVPKGLMALMSATNPTTPSIDGAYNFTMSKPCPAYLMALSVGDIQFAEIGPRTGIYAEPSMLKACANEFVDMEKMLTAAEELYGAYEWGRYDLIVLPPSFPFGGMENPMLTFATPTIIAGDRSLTALVAHELAHSWSGNLVTNATWNDFWLNEGFTVYFERRIMEKLYGKPYADMLSIIGYQDLQASLADYGMDNPATCLKLHLEGQNPDDGMNDIAYEKGYLLLLSIEQAVGRDRWDAFLKQYFSAHAFSTMTTEAFLLYLDQNLIKGDAALTAQLDLKTWIYSPGLPQAHPVPQSIRFQQVDTQVTRWTSGTPPSELAGTPDWSSHEWLHFIRHLPVAMDKDKMRALDQAFGFTDSGNAEIQAAWFEHVIRNDYTEGYAALEEFLVRVGRRKFLRPLYRLLIETEAGKARAQQIYQKARPNYHSVSRGTIDEMLGYTGE